VAVSRTACFQGKTWLVPLLTTSGD